MKSKNLRRLLAAVLCLVMVLSLFTACSKKEKDDDDEEEKEDEKTSSTYTTPLDKEMAIKNAKNYQEYEKAFFSRTSGLLDDEIKETNELIMKSVDPAYKTEMDENIRNSAEEYTAEYGDDYEFYYEINSKTELDDADLKDAEEEYKEEAAEGLKKCENTDPKDVAYDLSEADAKTLIKATTDFYEKMANFKITEGYELDVTYYVKGSELDEPKEIATTTIEVYKINDRWIILPIEVYISIL